MKKLKDLKKSITLKMEKLSEQELSFMTGGRRASAGSSGSGSGGSSHETWCCDGTTVHCCNYNVLNL